MPITVLKMQCHWYNGFFTPKRKEISSLPILLSVTCHEFSVHIVFWFYMETFLPCCFLDETRNCSFPLTS